MMMDMLRSVTGIEIFPVFSLVLFVTIFSIVLIWAWRADGVRLGRIASLPLDDEPHPAKIADHQ